MAIKCKGIAILVLLFMLVGCTNSSIYGKYILDEIDFLTLSSTSSIEEETNNNKDRVFKIEKDEFSISDVITVNSPIYQKEEFVSDIFNNKTNFWQDENIEFQYTILTQDEKETGYRLYKGKDSIFLITYQNIDNNIIVNSVYQLQK